MVILNVFQTKYCYRQHLHECDPLVPIYLLVLTIKSCFRLPVSVSYSTLSC